MNIFRRLRLIMLIPKIKYKKVHKGRIKGVSSNCIDLNVGNIALICLQRSRINSKQIESSRRVISRYIKNFNIKFLIRIFPNKPLTKKPLETRMGGGKMPIDSYVFNLKPGRILFEIIDIEINLGKLIFKKVSHKLPFKSTILYNDNLF